MNFQIKYDEYLGFFEEALKKFCAEMSYTPPVLAESMRYSLLSGGKRVRPVLFFSTLDILGLDYRKEAEFAIAIECIHTYSLIHDDLPAMDDDDYRRGNPSNHKVFGEANAILAGDALLSTACSKLLKEAGKDERHLRAARLLMDAAGASGMIAGQSADLFYTGKEGDEDALRFIYEHKTGKLITAPVVMAAILAGEGEAELERYGDMLGLLFQLTDDLLDEKGESAKMGKTLGKDREEGKLTCVRVFGMSSSEILADKVAAKCRTALEPLGKDVSFLNELVGIVRGRDN